jgi:hypothetical protein
MNLKGAWHEIFDIMFFHESKGSSPVSKALAINKRNVEIGSFSYFVEMLLDAVYTLLPVINFHRCRCYFLRQSITAVSMLLVIN